MRHAQHHQRHGQQRLQHGVVILPEIERFVETALAVFVSSDPQDELVAVYVYETEEDQAGQADGQDEQE